MERGEERFVRWVFDDPTLSRDLPADGEMAEHEETRPFDEGIQIAYRPGRRAGVRLVAGPDETTLRLFAPKGGEMLTEVPLRLPARPDCCHVEAMVPG